MNRLFSRRGLSAQGRPKRESAPTRKARRIVQYVLALIATASLLSACERATPGVTTVRFWAMGREGEVVTALVPEFERTHPGIRVVVQQLPWTAAHEKLLTAFAGDSTPDIAQLGNTWLPEFVALRALTPLDARLAGSSVVTHQEPAVQQGVVVIAVDQA